MLCIRCGRETHTFRHCTARFNIKNILINDKDPPEFQIIQKRKHSSISTPRSGVYVILHGNNRRFVGQSDNIDQSVTDHKKTLKDVFEVSVITPATDPDSWEHNETLAQMEKYGILSVRGSKYTAKLLMTDDILKIRSEICEKYDRCRNCGKPGHFSAECKGEPYDSEPSSNHITSSEEGSDEDV